MINSSETIKHGISQSSCFIKANAIKGTNKGKIKAQERTVTQWKLHIASTEITTCRIWQYPRKNRQPTREQYKELKRYEDSEIPIGDEGLSEIEEYLLKCGYIEASRMDVQSCPGIVQFYDSAYQITELGRQALSEYRHERYGKAFQVFLVLLGAAVALLADILLHLFC